MSFASVPYPRDPAERYHLLLEQTAALMDGIDHPISNMANVAALLWQALEDINWCGFYLMDRGALILGPFCGLPACIRIPLDRGVCGAAARTDKIQLVFDVHAFPGHIACDSASNSEIVIPIHHNGKVIGVLDIDSPTIGRFTETDQKYLTKLVRQIETNCKFEHATYSLK